MATARLVVVGDEILAGHTLDTNSHWVAGRLRDLGIDVVGVEQLPDDVGVLVRAITRAVNDGPEWVIVMGGLGPTPDDRTYEAVAQATGHRLDVRSVHVQWLKDRAKRHGVDDQEWADPERSEAARRMIRIPQGATPLMNPVGAALGCVLEVAGSRVVVLPGVPQELKAMFDEAFVPAFLPDAVASLTTLEAETRAAEAQWWPILKRLEAQEPTVRVGSYPQDPRGRLILRVRGPEEEARRVMNELRSEASRMGCPWSERRTAING